MDVLKKLAAVSRPISWINTAFPFAAGYLVLGGHLDMIWVIGTIFFLIPYNLLMYGINDVFDYESDMRNPRKGGIEGAKESKALHPYIIVSSIGLTVPFAIALCILGQSWQAAATLAFVLYMVVAYSIAGLRFKERPVLDSITSSTHFVGPLLFAMSLVNFPQRAWPYALAFFLWGMASHAFGAVQDIVPDREAGIGSIATVFGARWTVWLSLGLYTASIATITMANIGSWPVAVAGLLYVANILPFRSITDATSGHANAGWKRFIWLNMIAGAVVTVTLLYYSTR